MLVSKVKEHAFGSNAGASVLLFLQTRQTVPLICLQNDTQNAKNENVDNDIAIISLLKLPQCNK